MEGEAGSIKMDGRQKFWLIFWGYGFLLPIFATCLTDRFGIPYWHTLSNTPPAVIIFASCTYVIWATNLIWKSSSVIRYQIRVRLVIAYSTILNLSALLILAFTVTINILPESLLVKAAAAAPVPNIGTQVINPRDVRIILGVGCG